MSKNIGEFHRALAAAYAKRLRELRADFDEAQGRYAEILGGKTKNNEEERARWAKAKIDDLKKEVVVVLSAIPKCGRMGKMNHIKWPSCVHVTPDKINSAAQSVSLSAEFCFPDEKKEANNYLRVNIPAGKYGWTKSIGKDKWATNTKVYGMGQHLWDSRTNRGFTILPELKTALAGMVDWRKAFKKVRAPRLYNMFKQELGRYISAEGHQNVLIGVGRSSTGVGIAVSTSDPKNAWGFHFREPIYIHDDGVFADLDESALYAPQRATIPLRCGWGRLSGTFQNSPRRFHRSARRVLPGYETGTWEGWV